LLNVNAGNEAEYQAAIATETGFSDPPTVAEVQLIVDTVNASNYFVFTIDATNSAATPAGQFQIPSLSTNYQIRWAEVGNAANNSGGYQQITSPNQIIDFGAAGVYQVSIDPVGVATQTNDFSHFSFNGGGDLLKITGVSQWGSTRWSNLHSTFNGAVNLVDFTAIDTPDLTDAESLFGLFSEVPANPDVSAWDVATITNMAHMFYKTPNASPDTSNWDTSSVTSMSNMFSQAANANPDVSNWDVSSVTEMQH